MTPEEINAKLAAWLGWHLEKGFFTYRNSNGQPTGFSSADAGALPYFNPYHRIDHAWMLMEHIKTTQYVDAFGQWCDKYATSIFFEPAQYAAQAICTAILEITEQAT
jgi:hypothetical protein